MKRLTFIYMMIISICFSFFVLSCQSAILSNSIQSPTYEIFTGVVRYPGDLYFPSRVRLVITLNQINPVDNSSTFIVSQTINNPQRFPVNYTLRYLSEEINPSYLFTLTYNLFKEGEEKPYLTAKSSKIKLIDLNIPLDISLR